MLSRAITPKRKGRNWLTALAALSVLTGTLVFSSSNALALTQSAFELDKDATDDVVSLHLGTLKSSVNASAARSQSVRTRPGSIRRSRRRSPSSSMVSR